MRSIRRMILCISWQDKVSTADALSYASLPDVPAAQTMWTDYDGLVMSTVWRMAGRIKKRQPGMQKERSNSSRPGTKHGCDFCDKDCHSRIAQGIGLSRQSDAASAQQAVRNIRPIVISDRRGLDSVSNIFKINLFADDTSLFHTHGNFESLIK